MTFVEGAQRSAEARAFMYARGVNPQGFPLWTDEELATLRRLYPDIDALLLVINRPRKSIVMKACKLGLSRKRWNLTDDEVVRLRRLYRTAPRAELQNAFPNRSAAQICRAANYRGLKRYRRPYSPTGLPLLDQIRARCFDLFLTLKDLDELTGGTRGYYSRRARIYDLDKHRAAKAVKALEGRLVAKFQGGKLFAEWFD